MYWCVITLCLTTLGDTAPAKTSQTLSEGGVHLHSFLFCVSVMKLRTLRLWGSVLIIINECSWSRRHQTGDDAFKQEFILLCICWIILKYHRLNLLYKPSKFDCPEVQSYLAFFDDLHKQWFRIRVKTQNINFWRKRETKDLHNCTIGQIRFRVTSISPFIQVTISQSFILLNLSKNPILFFIYF